MSNIYYNGRELPSIVKSAEVDDVSTIEPVSARLCVSDDSSITSFRKLCLVVNDDFVYDWFEISPVVVSNITMELFQVRICDFLGIPMERQLLTDQIGSLKTTADLRRCLCASGPVIYLSSKSVDGEESPIRKHVPEPYPFLPSDHRFVTLSKKLANDKFGFSNIPSEGGFLIVSQIDTGGLLHASCGNWVEVGDAVLSVNGSTSVSAMRRELLVSDSVRLELYKRPLSV